MAKHGSDTNAKTPRNAPLDDDTTDRSPRQSDGRDSDARPMEWVQPDMLPTPEAKDGWVFRWIRTSMYGQQDNRNVSMRLREGWEPVLLEDHDELQIINDVNSDWAKKGAVEVGGLLLCKAPAELMESRRQKLSAQADRMMDAIDNNMMRQEDSRMPMFKERKTKVSFGS